jgi:hypothetical protein
MFRNRSGSAEYGSETSRSKQLPFRLHELLSAAEPLDLQEPDEEAMELARSYFEGGRRLMAGH